MVTLILMAERHDGERNPICQKSISTTRFEAGYPWLPVPGKINLNFGNPQEQGRGGPSQEDRGVGDNLLLGNGN